MKTNPEIKSAATIDAVISYTETLPGIRFKSFKKDRYNAPYPFHTDTKDSFMTYFSKKDELRFHCVGACKGDCDEFG
jgi:DNA primase